jgi:flagellar basal-body rod protein FlgF
MKPTGRLTGYTPFAQDTTSTAIRGMQLQMALMEIQGHNMAYADIPGYQKKEAVVSSFADVLGKHGVSESVNTDVGRLMMTRRPLELGLGSKGYFQKLKPDGHIETTRDGRFKLDKAGRLTSNEGFPILSQAGKPVVFRSIPGNLNDIKIASNGDISAINPKTKLEEYIDTIGVVSSVGQRVVEPDIKQGFVESSNVFAFDVFNSLIPLRRSFQANRQMFVNENQLLTRLIQELGRSQ